MKVSIAKEYEVRGKVFGKYFTDSGYFIDDYSLEESISNIAYSYAEGKYSCDCNKADFADIADGNYPCGDDEKYEELKLYCNGVEVFNLLEHNWFKE